jgi:phosphatidylglycerol phospholipase C
MIFSSRYLQPENRHVKFNIDVKVNNEPLQLFKLMHTALSAHAEWETALAPRLLIGLWHPKFIEPCRTILPHCRRSFIGVDIDFARKYFWKDCDAFSILFDSLSTPDGHK